MADQSPYFPPQTKIVGATGGAKVLLHVTGRSGAGKTHLGHQLLHDPDLGPDRILFLMAEDGSATYGEGAHVVQVETFFEAQARIKELIHAARSGKVLPPVLFIDSITGLADGQQQMRRREPLTEWSDKRNAYVENKQAQFGELGTSFIDTVIDARNKLPMDVMMMSTTWTPKATPKNPNPLPEYAVEGNMIPKHITRLSTCTLFLQPEANEYAWPLVKQLLDSGTLRQPHRFIDELPDPDKATDETKVMIVSRFFYTQDTGEVLTKGHRNLKMKERAHLPDVLRKIKGAAAPKGE